MYLDHLPPPPNPTRPPIRNSRKISLKRPLPPFLHLPPLKIPHHQRRNLQNLQMRQMPPLTRRIPGPMRNQAPLHLPHNLLLRPQPPPRIEYLRIFAKYRFLLVDHLRVHGQDDPGGRNADRRLSRRQTRARRVGGRSRRACGSGWPL